MMSSKSVLCNEKISSPINVGVARHSIVGATVYGAKLRNNIKKVKYNQQNFRMVSSKHYPNNTTMDSKSTKGLCFLFNLLTSTRPSDTSFICKCL